MLANAIAHVLVKRGKVLTSFIENHCRIVQTAHTGDVVQGGAVKDTPIDFAQYKAWLEPFAPEKVAARIGIQPGDLVLGINGLALESPDALRRSALGLRGRAQALVVVQRGSGRYHVTIPLV